MGSLTTCLRAAGDLLTPEQKQALIDRAAELRAQGMKSADADRQAVKDIAANTDSALSEVEAALADGRTLNAPSQASAGASAVERLAADRPEMDVRLPGDEKTMRLGDALKRVEAEKTAELQFGELVRVAAACAITGPAAI